jgi:hypothetical protein
MTLTSLLAVAVLSADSAFKPDQSKLPVVPPKG